MSGKLIYSGLCMKHVSLFYVYYLFIVSLPIYFLVVSLIFGQYLHSYVINIPYILRMIFSCNLFIDHLLLLFLYIFYVVSFTLTNLIL